MKTTSKKLGLATLKDLGIGALKILRDTAVMVAAHLLGKVLIPAL